MTCPFCVSAGPYIIDVPSCSNTQCPAGVSNCLRLDWDMDMSAIGLEMPSFQKICAIPTMCSMRDQDTCSWIGQFISDIGISTIKMSNCRSTCTPGIQNVILAESPTFKGKYFSISKTTLREKNCRWREAPKFFHYFA